MIAKTILVAAFALGLGAMPVLAGQTPSPEGAKVTIISPADGATVPNPVTVVFGLAGMGVDTPNTGHHHLLVDVDPSTIDLDSPVPSDDNHIHFGGGQTQTTLTLAPGNHTLILLLGDQNHIPHDPPVMSAPVTITVQ